MRRGRKPQWQRRIAKERINILLQLAKEETRKGNLKRAQRYVELARTIGKRYNVRLTKEQKDSFCKHCNTPLLPGLTSKVWLDSKTKTVVIKCLICNKIFRKPYKQK